MSRNVSLALRRWTAARSLLAAACVCAAVVAAHWGGALAGTGAYAAGADAAGTAGRDAVAGEPAAAARYAVGSETAGEARRAAGGEVVAGGARRAVRYLPYEPAREMQVAATQKHPAYAVYAWGDAGEARTALLVLHGMGEDGPKMAAPILPFAREQGWVVVAPTLPYGDWRDPSEVASEVVKLQPQLAELLSSVAAETGEQIADRALVFGFSRGAQAALRFTMLYPDRVQAVAAASAGTYTLPVEAVQTSAGGLLNAPLPYGVADLPQRIGHGLNTNGLAGVRFLISVGEADNHEEDVPRQWDPYVGKNRVERAKRFEQLLEQQGYQATISVVPLAGHEVNGAVIERVTAFLAQSPAAPA